MNSNRKFEIFLATAPGLEPALLAEVRAKGFNSPVAVPGGVTIRGGWPEVWRANLWVRGAGRVLARIATLHVPELGDLEKRARLVPWADVMRPDVPFRVEATCRKSRIYHSGAAEERIDTAIRDALGLPPTATEATPPDEPAPDDTILVMARIDHDVCTLSLDTSGGLLHKRGYKQAVAKAPMRETMASLFLAQCGFDGSEPVLDPMCGSGTFVIEAAEIAARLNPGRARRFAFERFANFDAAAWQRMRDVKSARTPAVKFYGSDRDEGAVAMSRANADRAGVSAFTEFTHAAIADAAPPDGPTGLVIANPPYGTRIGDKKALVPVYRAFGRTMLQRFTGWRIAIVTTEPALAHATGLPFLPTAVPVAHGGLRVTLFQTAPLA